MNGQQFTEEQLQAIKTEYDRLPPDQQMKIKVGLQEMQKQQQTQQPQQTTFGRLGSAGLAGLQGAFKAMPSILMGQAPAKEKTSEVKELIELEKFKSLMEMDKLKREQAEFKLQEDKRKSNLGAKVEEEPTIDRQSLTVGGGVSEAPTQPRTPQPKVDFSQMPTGSTPTDKVDFTGIPNIDSIIEEVGNIPLMLDTVSETVDNTGKISRTKKVQVNPLVTKALEAKFSRQGKLDDVEFEILKKGKDEQAQNLRNADAITGLAQNTVAVWKAAAQEKEKIPKIFGSSKLRAVMPDIAEGLNLEGFNWSKAYIGQRIETAMALSKIITGGARIIKSVISELMKTLPQDDAITKDMESKIYQSIMNATTRAYGRPLTPEEKAETDAKIREVLSVDPAQIPPEDMASMLQSIPTHKRIEVNGVEYNIPIEEFEEALKDIGDNDIITFLD